MAPWFPCKRHTGLYRDVVRGAPRVLVLHFVASCKAILEAIIVLDVLVVELLLILVKIDNSFDLLCDGESLGGCLGERLLGAAAFSPIIRIALGLPWGSSSLMASFRPCSAIAFARSRRRRKVSLPRGFFRGKWS